MPSVGVGVSVVFRTFEPGKKAEVKIRPNVVVKFDPNDREAVEFISSLIISPKVHAVIRSEKIKK